MGLSLAGLQSGVQSAAKTVLDLVGQTVTALQFVSSQASGSDAFKVTTSGARWHIGAGALDYLSSDGTTISSPASQWWLSSGAGIFLNTLGTRRIYDNGTNITVNSSFDIQGAPVLSDFLDDSGTTGDRTSNHVRGFNAFGAGSAAITITNSFVTATSQILCTLMTNDATALLKNVVPGAGSFVITLNAVTTGITKVAWIVVK